MGMGGNTPQPERSLARIIAADLGLTIAPEAIRMFIRKNWSRLSALAHDIHGTSSMTKSVTPAPDALSAAEPAAWMHPTAGWTDANFEKIRMHCRNDGPMPIPLYRTPATASLSIGLLIAAEEVVDAYDARGDMPATVTALEAALRKIGFCRPFKALEGSTDA